MTHWVIYCERLNEERNIPHPASLGYQDIHFLYEHRMGVRVRDGLWEVELSPADFMTYNLLYDKEQKRLF